jgi:hypothetical protein
VSAVDTFVLVWTQGPLRGQPICLPDIGMFLGPREMIEEMRGCYHPTSAECVVPVQLDIDLSALPPVKVKRPPKPRAERKPRPSKGRRVRVIGRLGSLTIDDNEGDRP